MTASDILAATVYSREELTSITQGALLKKTDYSDKMLQGYQSTPQALPECQLHIVPHF